MYLTEVPISKETNKIYIPNKLKIELNSIKPSMTLYGTEEIYEYFIEIITEIANYKSFGKKMDDDISEMMETFNQMILKDLKI